MHGQQNIKTNNDSPLNISVIFYFGITTCFGRFRPLSGYQHDRKRQKYV